MRLVSTTTTCLLLSPIQSFTLPSASVRRPSPLSLATSGGPEALQEFLQTLPSSPSAKRPQMAKLVGAAALPLSGLLGAALTPSSHLAARALVGVVTAATAGGVGKSALDEDVRKACPSALASVLLRRGVEAEGVAEEIAGLKRQYGLEQGEFGYTCVQIYAVYLVGMAKNPILKMAELKELSKLKEVLGLENLQVGQAHAQGAANFYRDIVRFTSKEELEDEEHPDRICLDKFLFLSERAFRQAGETPEAFTFEFSRVAKALGGLDIGEGMDRVRAVARPFYDRALTSTRAKLDTGAVSAETLSRARDTLGMDEGDAKDMHVEAFAKEIRVLLGLPEEETDEGEEEDMALDYDQDKRLSTDKEARERLEEMKAAQEKKEKRIHDTSEIKFKEGAWERLCNLQQVLSITDEDANYEILAATGEYWRQTALATLRDATNKIIPPNKAWNIIYSRQKELFIKDSNMKDLMINIVMQTMGRPLEKVNGFARVNNAAATYDGLIDAIAAKEVCNEVCRNAGWEEFDDFESACFDPNDTESACGFLSRIDRQNMYNLFFGRSIKIYEDGRKTLDDEARARLKELRGMLGISDDDGENQIRSVFGPELYKVLTTATDEIMGGNVTQTLMETLKKDVELVISDFKLEDEMLQSYAGPLYEKAVEQISRNTPGGIPSKEEVDILKSLREFLQIKEEESYKAHLQYFGEAYRKGIKEALGTTGVIREEFREPLADLRSRLGVSDDAAKKIYMDAVGDRMQPMVEYISGEMERLVLTNDQLAQRRGVDYGEDFFKSGNSPRGKLGLGTEGNIMGDILNLVDFYVENGIVEQTLVGTKTVEKMVDDNSDGEDKAVTEEVPIYESTYPITAIGRGWIEPKVAELCYRQFLVNSFTDQSPTAARYEASKTLFGGILGLTAKQMEEVGSSIGGMVYDNYINQALSTKEALDQQDMMFLASIQGKLGISPEQGEQMLLDTQKKIMSEEASILFDGKDAPTPEKVKAFREKCNSLGLDLEADVGLSRSRVVSMFSMEISPGIDSGEITMDSGDLLAEIQESLGLTEEEGEEVVASIITHQAAGIYLAVRSCLLRGMDVEALDYLKKLVQYARFVDGDLGLEVAETDAWKAFGIFENADFTGINKETVEEQKSLLKVAMGLSSQSSE